MKFRFPRLPKTLGVDDKTVLAVELAAKGLKKQNLERIKQLAILGQCKMRILATQIEQTALVGPLSRNAQIKTQIRDKSGEEFFGVFTTLPKADVTVGEEGTAFLNDFKLVSSGRLPRRRPSRPSGASEKHSGLGAPYHAPPYR